MTFKQVLKGREPVVYARVSTKDQKNTLKNQIATLEKWLKANGITRKPKVFQEVVSGTSINPPELEKAIIHATQKPSKSFLLVRDFQRISRNWRYGGRNMIELFENDIPVVSAIKNTLSATKVSPTDDDWLIGLYMALGAQEVDLLKKRSDEGTKVSEAKGIFSGSPPNLFPEEPLNPYRELVRLLEAGVGQNESSRRLSKSTAWFRKRREFLSDVRERGGDKLLEEYLTVTDKIRDIQQNLGKGADDRKRLRAVNRMTSGFLQRPTEFPAPTDENLNEYITNFKLYQPSRKKK